VLLLGLAGCGGGAAPAVTTATSAAASAPTQVVTSVPPPTALSTTEAATSVTEAATSVTEAATSVTEAATSATEAATSATEAATSATEAATSTTEAATSTTEAATSVPSALTAVVDPTQTAQLSATAVANLPPPPTNPDDPGIRTVGLIPLTGSQSPVTAVYTVGMRDFAGNQKHYVTIYSYTSGRWRQVTGADLPNADYIDAQGVRQVMLDPRRNWIEVQSGAGAHGGCYDLLSFNGTTLHNEVSYCHDNPDAGSLEDLNGDGVPDVVLNTTDDYVFCYACGVREQNIQVFRWDGSHMQEVKLTPLPASAPAQLRQMINQAVTLAEGGFWKDAQATISATMALQPQDPTARWDAALIGRIASARANQVQRGAYPLLENIFYGDYPAALKVMRPLSAAQLFSSSTPLIKGTPADGWNDNLSAYITTTVDMALQVQPNLAAAYFLRGWAENLHPEQSQAALADIAHAASLDPNEQLYARSLAYLRRRG